MPNCDFYAADQDFQPILRFVFDELDCRVFESYSANDSELIEFSNIDQIWSSDRVGKCVKRSQSICLQLWPVNASRNVRIRKIDLDPVSAKGATYRYCVEGWGLIQLYLGGESELGIVHSHTNHNSEKRTLHWADVYRSKLGDPKDWDWSVVQSQSGRLNRRIRKAAVSKIGSRPVLPYAQRLLDGGAKPL